MKTPQIDEADAKTKIKIIWAMFWMGAVTCVVAAFLGELVAMYRAWKMLLFQNENSYASPALQTLSFLFLFSAAVSIVSLAGIIYLKIKFRPRKRTGASP